MATAHYLISMLVAPVVMISACGLFCLALYARLAAVVGRLRVFHAEKYETSRKLEALPADKQASPEAQVLRERYALIDAASSRSLARARMLRNALVALLSSVICVLLSSLTIGVAMVIPGVQYGAMVIFFLGVATMIVGIVQAMGELFVSVESITTEQLMVSKLDLREEGGAPPV